MHFDFSALPAQTVYNVLTSTVTPRPIAWVTTVSGKGVVNAAPFSFFNVMGHQPPTVAIGLMRHASGELKDTGANIIENGEFVVNLVPESLVRQMNQTCADYPADVDEMAAAGLTARPASHVRPPLIQGSPVSLECVSQATVVTGPRQIVVIGRVLGAHVDDAYVQDAARGYVDTPALGLIARMHGGGWYARSTDTFQLARPTAPQ
ncbi:flavin reductase family protein [Achromobacter deleyi]|uniref:flavin reductase family protein n=1 Tax=Achromobacter deleyi TaxID=1353891 RepID=UPI001490C887|nr:flavin reductase family protein [Achromobacter deleyi]QVQ24480.1 flavin reductase family protein [Achromobacter deleyi]UIP20012.1 flavin reductase family protein [Achromobacter deleyi]